MSENVLPTPDEVRRVIAQIDPLDLHAPGFVDAKCIAPDCGEKCWPHRFFCRAHRHLVPPAAVAKTAEVTRAAFALLLTYEAYREELTSEASFITDPPAAGPAAVQSGALDALWERVEAARQRLMELSA